MNNRSFALMPICFFIIGLGLLLYGIISAKQSISILAFAIAWLEFASGFLFLSSEHRLTKSISAFTWLATVFGMTLFLWIVARPIAIAWLAFLAIVFGVTVLLSRIYGSYGSKIVTAACFFTWLVAPNFAFYLA
jgi:hypothetical protein